MASVTYSHNNLSGFYGKSGVGSSWTWGTKYSGGGGGYVGYGSSGSAVAVFYVPIPTALKNQKVTINYINFTIQLARCSGIASGKQLGSYMSVSTASTDTPSGWMNSGPTKLGDTTLVYATTPTAAVDSFGNVTFNYSAKQFNLSAANTSGVYIYIASYPWNTSAMCQWNLSTASRFSVTFNYTEPTVNTYKPTSITRTTFGYGLYSGAQYFQGKSSYSGRWLVGNNPTGPYYVRSESTANSTSCNFKVDQDTSTSRYYKLYYCTVIPNQTATYSGTANYLTFVAPSYTWQVHLCSTGTFEMTSADKYKSQDYTLGSQDPPISGYTFVGYASSPNTTSVDQTASSTWVATYNNKERWCVFKKSASSKSITLYNCSSSSVATAKSTTAEAWLYGESPTPSGGGTTYTNGSYSPSAPSGYTSFKGWATSSGSYTVAYSNPQSAFEAGYAGSLYALWDGTTTTTCSLNGNGYSIASSSAWKQVTKRKYGYGSTTTMSTRYSTNHSYQPVNSSATFIEWNTNSSGTGTSYDAPMDALDAGYTGTLYAIWQANEYTVTYNPGRYGSPSTTYSATTTNYKLKIRDATYTRSNGTTYYTNYYLSGGSIVSYNYPSSGYTYSATAVANGPRYQIKDAIQYQQNYWNQNYSGAVASSGDGVDYWRCGSTYTLTSNLTLYPEWTTIKAKFNPPNVSRVGYKFVTWNTSADGTGTNYSSGTNYEQTSNMSLYAIWEPEWSVKINNGTDWGDYHVWIYTGATSNNGWQQAIPYVYDGSNWKLTKI